MILAHKVPTTLISDAGEIYGLIDHEGNIHLTPESNVGKPVIGWNEVTARREIVGVVAWDGSAPSTWGKGDLMGDYGNVQRVHRQFGGPRFKTATYGQLLEDVNPNPEKDSTDAVV